MYIYKKTKFQQEQDRSSSPLCKQLTANDSCLNTKWRHVCSGCEVNRLSASLKTVPFGRTVPPRDPCAWAAEAATMKQQAAAIISMHCVITFGRRERLCLCLVCILPWWALAKRSIHVCDCPYLCSMFVFICREQLTTVLPSKSPAPRPLCLL